MATISKEALIFKNRLKSFEEDLELVDIICTANRNDDFLRSETSLFKYVNPSKHKSLAGRKNTKGSRNITVNHLKKTIYVSYIKDIFEELSLYLKSFVNQAALLSKDNSTAARLLGEQKIKFSAKDLLQYSSLEDLIKVISEQIVQDLEKEKSTKSLIEKIISKTGIEIDDTTVVDEALPYLEIRHKFVHTDGKVDDEFKNAYPMFTYDKDDYIQLNKKTLENAKIKISKLVLEIDDKAIKKGILMPNTP